MRMRATLGITEPKFTRDPLGTEGEMTEGPDDQNPYETGETGAQPDLPPVVGDDVPLAGDDVVEAFGDAAAERNQRLDSVFEFGGSTGGKPGAFDPERESFRETLEW